MWRQVLNKTDLLRGSDKLQQLQEWFAAHSSADAILPASALTGKGISAIKEWAVSRLPLGASLYPKVGCGCVSTCAHHVRVCTRSMHIAWPPALADHAAHAVVNFRIWRMHSSDGCILSFAYAVQGQGPHAYSWLSNLFIM